MKNEIHSAETFYGEEIILQNTYIDEKGYLKISSAIYEEIKFSFENDRLFLSEQDNCIIISNDFRNLPVCEIAAHRYSIYIQHDYCVMRGLFNPREECVRETNVYGPKANGKSMRRTYLTSEYKIQYYIKDNALIIPLTQKQIEKDYCYCTKIENGRLVLPSFILQTIGIRNNTALKAEVRNDKIYCFKCPKTTIVKYNQTITYDNLNIAFQEQLLKTEFEEIQLESFLLRATRIQPNDIVKLRLVTKKEFVIEKLY